MLIVVATKHQWKLHQLFKSTFLNGDLEEDIYLRHREQFVRQGHEHFLSRLKKALYGLSTEVLV